MMEALEKTAGSAKNDMRLRRLFENHRLAVLAYCMRRTSRWDALDAAAEVFAVAWRRIDDIPEGDEALPWLYGVARRVLANMQRSARRRYRLQARIAAAEPRERLTEPVTVQRAEYQWVIDAAGRLSEADREILFLAAWEELSHREAAAVLGITEVAARKRLERARRRLDKELERTAPSGLRTARGSQ